MEMDEGLTTDKAVVKRVCSRFDKRREWDEMELSTVGPMTRMKLEEIPTKLEEMRRCASAHKIPGQASIQTGSGVHEFMVGDHDHPQTDDIFSKMNRLIRIMKRKENSVPYLDLTE